MEGPLSGVLSGASVFGSVVVVVVDSVVVVVNPGIDVTGASGVVVVVAAPIIHIRQDAFK